MGVGGERYLPQLFSCDGDVLQKRAVTALIASGIVGYLPTPSIHLAAFAGRVSAQAGSCTSVNGSGECSLFEPFEGTFAGTFAGGLLLREGNKIAVGLGAVSLPREQWKDVASGSNRLLPSLHLRVGRRAGTNAAIDINRVSAAGEPPMSTLGVQFVKTGASRKTFYLGLGVLPYPDVSDEGAIAAVGRAAFPLGGFGDALFGGYVGAGQMIAVNAGLRLHLPVER